MKRFVFWVWALCAAAPGFADQVTIDGVTWEYNVYFAGGTPYAAIKKASGVQGAVTVPATLGGAPVTELETGFFGMSGVFYGCTELTAVRWEEGCVIEKIGGYAFRGCTSLTQITIPPSVTKLGNQAFRGSGLKSVTIPGTVKTLGAEVFAECPDLKTAVFEKGDELYDADVGDGLFIACPECRSDEILCRKRNAALRDGTLLCAGEPRTTGNPGWDYRYFRRHLPGNDEPARGDRARHAEIHRHVCFLRVCVAGGGRSFGNAGDDVAGGCLCELPPPRWRGCACRRRSGVS